MLYNTARGVLRAAIYVARLATVTAGNKRYRYQRRFELDKRLSGLSVEQSLLLNPVRRWGVGGIAFRFGNKYKTRNQYVTVKHMPPAKTDSNQAIIVDMFRRCGATVCLLHAVGRGVPDLLVGYRGHNLLVEVKTGSGQLNDLQIEWHASWRGQAAVIRDTENVLPLLSTLSEQTASAAYTYAAQEPAAHRRNFRSKYKPKTK